MIRQKFDPSRVRRLLIRSTNWIGDAVMTTPAVRAIRRNFGRAEISILVKPWVAPVFADSPHVDRLLIYDAAGRHHGSSGKLRLARELRRRRFDAAILLQNAFEAALITWLAGIPRRVGYKTDARGPLLTHGVRCTAAVKRVHQTRYYLTILEALGMSVGSQRLDLFLGPAGPERAGRILRARGVSPHQRLVGINPSATFGPAKQWLPESFARLADRIQEHLDARILMFGGPGDRQLGERIQQMAARPMVNLCGRTSLEEAMALIQVCDLFISNDSGLMHVAAALDVPLIAIFGSTNPVATGPYSVNSRVLQASLPCAPCCRPTCPLGHMECMTRIDVETVFRSASDLMAVAG